MPNSFLRHAAVITLAAGVVFAQGPNGSQSSTAGTQAEGQDTVSRHLEKLAQVFDLTDSQKEQARTMFDQAEQSAKPVQQESQQNLEGLAAAAKSGKSEGDIQKLAQEEGRLLGQLLAIRTQAWAKFYQILTPEQRAKVEQTEEHFRQEHPTVEHKNGP
ncbi:MAG TPA: Spy/CpxP family protein refolding chaperone [Bryobacteraceae bacterium]